MTFDELATLDYFTFEVTQEDIDEGQPNSTTRCPIAHAVKRTMEGNYCYVPSCKSLTPIEIKTLDNKGPEQEWLFFEHSQESRKFVHDFDLNLEAKPTTITLKRYSI